MTGRMRIGAGVLTALLAGAAFAAGPATPKVILVTGFEPFGGDATNGSWEAVRTLDGTTIGGARVVVAQLPVVWGDAAARLRELVKANNPAAIVCFGQAGVEPVRLESTAHNVRDNYPDNKGAVPSSLTIEAAGPATLESSLPLADIGKRLNAAGIPARVSPDAGGYLCNDTFYVLMHDAVGAPIRGFVHVPPLDAEVAAESGTSVRFDGARLRRTAEIVVEATADKIR